VPTQFVNIEGMLAVAQAYVAAGLSPIPITVDGEKRPLWTVLPEVQRPDGQLKPSWKPYQTRLPTPDELRRFFVFQFWPPGIAVVCGAVSGGLEVIDFDDYSLVQPWADLVAQHNASILPRLVFSQTPRPGLHCFYRCPTIERNQKLAERFLLDPQTGVAKLKALIETRGEGGYCVVPPSSGGVHPSGRPYVFLNGRDLTMVPTITAAERAILMAAARSFNVAPVRPPRLLHQRRRPTSGPLGDRPGDHFNYRTDWGDLLRRHKWSLSSVDADGTEHWCRPGKSGGTSATLGYEGSDVLYVFSSNAAPLEQETGYTKFSFLTHMEYRGDFTAAALALRAKGYGRAAVPTIRSRRRRGQR
jgi:putative DNA primase/helicase